MSAEDSSLAHLFGRLQVVEARARAAVWTRRARDSRPDDRFRGLYISDEEIDLLLAGKHTPQPRSSTADSILARVEARADAAEATGADIRLRRLARSFELCGRDLDLLVVALAPDLDARFERLFAYLHDDVTRGRASTGLALELCGAATVGWPDRQRLRPGGPLVDGGLLLVEEADRPFLTRPLRVPDRVIGHLLGDDSPDELLRSVAGAFVDVDFLDVDIAVNALRSGERLFYVQEQAGQQAIRTRSGRSRRARDRSSQSTSTGSSPTRMSPSSRARPSARLGCWERRSSRGRSTRSPTATRRL